MWTGDYWYIIKGCKSVLKSECQSLICICRCNSRTVGTMSHISIKKDVAETIWNIGPQNAIVTLIHCISYHIQMIIKSLPWKAKLDP